MMMKWFDREFDLGLPAWRLPAIVERLRGTPARLEERLAGVGRDVLVGHPADDAWSIQQNAGHLLDLEPLWVGRVEDFRQGEETLRPADLTNRRTYEAGHDERPIAEILALFRTARADLVALLEAADDELLTRTALHPRLRQPMAVVDHAFFVAEHDDHHLARITELLRLVSGRFRGTTSYSVKGKRGPGNSKESGSDERGPREGYWLGIDDEDTGSSAPGSAVSDAEHEHRDVQVTTVVPESVRPGESFLVEVVLHVEGYEVVSIPGTLVRPESAYLSLPDGTRLTVRLVPFGEAISLMDDSEVEIAWMPPARRAEFLLAASRDAEEGMHPVRLEFWLHEVQVARAYIRIVVDPRSARPIPGPPNRVLPRLPRSAFASYCRRDEGRVQDRISALRTVGIDVFYDCLDIRQGADSEDVLNPEIDARERFLLFWSCAARDSEWVEKEWRYALANRGIDYILPNALEPPARCPPPDELKDLNFGSAIDRIRRDWHDPWGSASPDVSPDV